MPRPLSSDLFPPREYGSLERISDRVFIFRNITNSSFVIGDRSVAVIDTQVNHPSALRLLKCIRSVTDKPIEWAINTHYHWDHTNGNQIFKDQGAKVLSSKLTKEFMVGRHDRQKEFLSGRGFELSRDPLLPEVTFEGEFSVDVGNQPLRCFFAGRAETDDATAIFVEKEKILMSGDTVMTGSFPIFGQPVWDEGLQGDGAWQETIQKLLSFKPIHIIPGHGPLAHEGDVEKLIDIENYFVEEVKKLVEIGFSSQKILENLEPRLPDWITKMPIVWGTPRYAILRVFRGLTKKKNDPNIGWQHLKPSAIPFLQMAHEAGKVLPPSPDALAAYAESLIAASRAEPSVLEKGDFFEAARRAWDLALEISPNHAASLLGKGRYLVIMAYRGGDDPQAGIALLEKLLGTKPGGCAQEEAEFYLGLGRRVIESMR